MNDPQKGNRPMDNPLSILLIEDNPDDRVLIKRGLNKGFNNLHIEEVLNQEDLDEIIAKGDFNVAITDYNLGWTDGVAVLTAIKEKRPDCPVVMMTVMDTEEIAIDAMEAGLDDYVVKSPSQFARLPDIVTTVLEHKERGRALKEVEVRYKDLYDSVPVGLFRTKLDGQIVSVNQALVDMLHYPDRESLIATNANELYVDPNERSANMEEVKERGIIKRREHKLFRYDNEEITVEISIYAIRNDSGEVDVLDGYLEDITERKRVEEALSQTEVLNKTIIESVQEGVIVYDRDLRYVVWNNFMEKFTGMHADNVVGKIATEFIPHLVVEEIEPLLRRVLNGETVRSSDIPFYNPENGKTGWIEGWYGPLISQEGEVIGIVATIHDITRRKESETERERMLTAERKRARELSALTTAATTISSNLDIKEILRVVAKELAQLLNIDSCAIYTWDPENNTIALLVEHLPEGYQKSHKRFHSFNVDQWLNTKEVMENGRSIQINISDPDLLNSSKEYLNESGIKSLLMVPLISQDKTIGLVELEDFDETRTFSEQEIVLAQMFSNQAAVALENARLFDETTETLRREQQLNEITRTISSDLDLPMIMEKVGQLASDLVGGDAAGISLMNPNTQSLFGLYYYNPPPNAPHEITSKETGLMWEIMETRKSILIRNYPDHPLAMPFWTEVGVHGSIIVPFVSGETIIGVLGVFTKDEEKQFSQRDLELIESVGRQAGMAIQRTLLFEETKRRTDELTALYDIALATGSVLYTPTLLRKLQDKVKLTLNPDSYGVFIFDQESDEFEIVIALDKDEVVEEAVGTKHTLKEGGLTGWVMANREPLLIKNIKKDELPVAPKHFNLQVCSWLGVPLISGDRLVGALSVQSYEPNMFDEEDRRFLESLAGQVSTALENARLYEELEDAFMQTVLALANAMDVRDTYTIDHSQRMAVLAEKTGRLLGGTESELETLRWAALLHDIGKIGVPDDILLKPSSLTKKEYEIIKNHPALGASIISPIKKLKEVAPIIHHSHEKYDGTGYPEGLGGEEIPLEARILMVVDSFIAMTDDRVYRKARDHEEAVEEIKSLSGKQYDPKVVEVFLELIESENKPIKG